MMIGIVYDIFLLTISIVTNIFLFRIIDIIIS